MNTYADHRIKIVRLLDDKHKMQTIPVQSHGEGEYIKENVITPNDVPGLVSYEIQIHCYKHSWAQNIDGVCDLCANAIQKAAQKECVDEHICI
ncbi:MAG: hypothetical protein JRJ00_03305 [Deltaproteobacteria bacterium]|nr:hypothetical protein [Deltaproteobacteria bacterium]